jgi:hypothetical protein
MNSLKIIFHRFSDGHDLYTTGRCSKVYVFCDNVSTFNNKYYLLVLKSVVNMPKKVTTRGECQAPPKNLKIEMHLPYNICYVIIKGYRMVFRAGLRDPCTRDVAPDFRKA